MLCIRAVLASGVTVEMHVNQDEGTSDDAAADELTDSRNKLNKIAGKDAKTGAHFFIQCEQVEFLTVAKVAE